MTEWRFIDSGPGTASYNMALDEAIAQSVREGRSPVTLRVYEWLTPSVSLGCFQRSGSIDLEYCSERGIPVVRRITGGRAILHGPELTYSLSASTSDGPFSGGLMDSYRRISDAFCRTMSLLGLSPEARIDRNRESADSRNPLCFHSVSFAEISLRGRKAVGSAQKRWKDGLLQQGSVPYSIDEETTKRVFRIDTPVNLGERMIALSDAVPGFNPERFKEAVRVSFGETFGIRLIPSAPSREEHLLALELESRRYRSREWTFQR